MGCGKMVEKRCTKHSDLNAFCMSVDELQNYIGKMQIKQRQSHTFFALFFTFSLSRLYFVHTCMQFSAAAIYVFLCTFFHFISSSAHTHTHSRLHNWNFHFHMFSIIDLAAAWKRFFFLSSDFIVLNFFMKFHLSNSRMSETNVMLMHIVIIIVNLAINFLNLINWSFSRMECLFIQSQAINKITINFTMLLFPFSFEFRWWFFPFSWSHQTRLPFVRWSNFQIEFIRHFTYRYLVSKCWHKKQI